MTEALLDIQRLDAFYGDFQALYGVAMRVDRGDVIAETRGFRQAAMLAYVNDFYLMMWLAIAALPLTLLMRKAAPPPSPSRKPCAG